MANEITDSNGATLAELAKSNAAFAVDMHNGELECTYHGDTYTEALDNLFSSFSAPEVDRWRFEIQHAFDDALAALGFEYNFGDGIKPVDTWSNSGHAAGCDLDGCVKSCPKRQAVKVDIPTPTIDRECNSLSDYGPEILRRCAILIAGAVTRGADSHRAALDAAYILNVSADAFKPVRDGLISRWLAYPASTRRAFVAGALVRTEMNALAIELVTREAAK